jgi:hypothetical protein
MPLPCTGGQNCIVPAFLCGNSSSEVEDLIGKKYKLNFNAEMERQLCISVQCLCASNKGNLAANICAFYLVK